MERSFSVGLGSIEVVEGDITRQVVDVVVNAANSRLSGGGGVDGAIHRAAGPELDRACRRIGVCPTGSAVFTPAFRLTARRILHAVGPIWEGGGRGEAAALRSAYETCLRLAAEEGWSSIALPSISTGAYGYPMREASAIAVNAAREHLEKETSLRTVRFVLYGEAACGIFRKVAEELLVP